MYKRLKPYIKMKKLLPALFVLFALTAGAQQHELKKLWQTDTVVRTPESVLPDLKKKILYVSEIEGDGNTKDGKGGVAKLGLDGKIINLDFTTGLNAPKGLGRFGNTLYVADLTEIVEVNMNTGKVIKKIPVAGSKFLNDVTVDDKGTVYVSDTRVNVIYKLENGQVSVFLNDAKGANGLKAIGTDLYALVNPDLIKIDASGKRTTIATLPCGGDGLEPIGNGDWLATCWNGYIFYVTAAGKVETLLDIHGGKLNTADIGYDPQKHIVYVPTFNGNMVQAFELVSK
ncbi:hypothetical protein C8P68_11069 [Mucilaginibacter yixingensis]|uniref:Sugar lactone lactonase YvrE n=2 Tax=Mucilaginibacter yixingensis TaxID=1295612 RepID=A0A2T5J540_9SPHI|nr:hypothetical protein C8P68_11069 [Mucilaginibacter yixingensis]